MHMNKMLGAGALALLGIGVLAGVFLAKNPPSIPFIATARCAKPIAYAIGSIDARFALTTTDVQKALHEAEELWERTTDRDLFIAMDDTENAISVQLVFDERQEETRELQKQLSSLTIGKEGYETWRAEYEALINGYRNREKIYASRAQSYQTTQEQFTETVASYEEDLARHEEEVGYWNKRGGAPQEEFSYLTTQRTLLEEEHERLLTTQEQLRQDYAWLQKEEESLRAAMNTADTLAGALNRVAQSLRVAASDYGKISVSREEFVTGQYRRENGTETISVFQFFDYDELVLILAHEMGHAIGLDHAQNTDAIMYPSIGDQEKKLAPEDLRMLESYCR